MVVKNSYHHKNEVLGCCACLFGLCSAKNRNLPPDPIVGGAPENSYQENAERIPELKSPTRPFAEDHPHTIGER